ncbi:hypothetical protein NDU88_002706 [Pleurodeles waltl]|uniref:Uncharacterized protein n=1 Tax=Pleurodeles waltl TaxID=8319 RepID=A0AAV7KSX8_PLEWA|nr:hypothetical protein NDU88_002706 [Pleurodeles waltl]
MGERGPQFSLSGRRIFTPPSGQAAVLCDAHQCSSPVPQAKLRPLPRMSGQVTSHTRPFQCSPVTSEPPTARCPSRDIEGARTTAPLSPESAPVALASLRHTGLLS